MTDLRSRISSFLDSLTTLSLATVDAGGHPSAAAVYFAHDVGLNLYFLSAKTTLHGQNLLANPAVAATAYEEHQDWKSLRGLQLRGRAHPVVLTRLPHAAMVYGRKYAFARLDDPDPGAIAKALSTTTLWQLTSEWFRITDNSKGFGFKEELDL